MSDYIRRFEPDREYYFEEGCHINETSNSDTDEALSIVRARVTPGVRTRWHYLKNTTERYVILSGTGTVEIGDSEPCAVATGDVVIIPPGTPQRIRNSGEEDLLFLAICSPRFQRENYREGRN